jgi:hypothetical protein
VHTAGTAGNGRREFYGVRRTRRILDLHGEFRGADLGGLAELRPPVRFGFSSAPAVPALVSVTTTIDLPSSVDDAVANMHHARGFEHPNEF